MVTSLTLAYMGTRSAEPTESLLERLAVEGAPPEVPVPAPAPGSAEPAAEVPQVAPPAGDDAVPVPAAPPPAQ